MLRQIIDNPRYVAYAIVVHVAFVAVIVLSLDWTTTTRPKPTENIVDAIVVDETKVLEELAKLKKEQQRKKNAEEKRNKKLEKQARDAKKKRQKEEKRLAELKKKKNKEQRLLKEQQKKRLFEEQRAKELEDQKKIETERLAELKREQQALEQKQLEEQQRQQQLAAEQRQLDAEREKKVQSILDRYIEIIKQKVTRNWFKPAGAKQGLSCIVKVRLIPGGEVLDVRIINSSGDPVFDRSVETAVLKASPLPLPADSSLFERFRVLQFVFKPEE